MLVALVVLLVLVVVLVVVLLVVVLVAVVLLVLVLTSSGAGCREAEALGGAVGVELVALGLLQHGSNVY